jgi:hypothetical protein
LYHTIISKQWLSPPRGFAEIDNQAHADGKVAAPTHMDSIYEFVKNARNEYYSRTIEVVPGYTFSQHETLRTIELYANSKFLSTNKDSLGREKPFFNICKFRVNVAVQATDLDTKDVQIQSESEGAYAQSFLLSLKNRNWMRDTSFPRLLNRMGQTRAKFGGVLVKKTEHGSDLRLHVVPWRDVITDQVDNALTGQPIDMATLGGLVQTVLLAAAAFLASHGSYSLFTGGTPQARIS